MVEKITQNADIRIVLMAILYYVSAHLGFLISAFCVIFSTITGCS
jgi:general stress protein CsbA